MVRALSGLPFTLQDTTVDADRNDVVFDPIASGSYTGTVPSAVAGTGPVAYSANNKGGRNGARGPGFFQADVRVGYQFRFGQQRLEAFGEVFNLTNRANFVNPTGDRSSANFLVLNALRPGAIPRTGQLGLRFVF